MADLLAGGRFTIVSYTPAHQPIGVNLVKLPIQNVYVGAPVRDWGAQRVGDGTYKLSVGPYRYVGVQGKAVVASIDQVPETIWKITYQEFQKAYTIALADEPHLGWTVDAESHTAIVIGPIISTRSLPPQFLPDQLFLIQPAGNE